MILNINYAEIIRLFENAEAEERDILFEFEVYTLLRYSGAETPPKNIFIPKHAQPTDEELMVLPGDKAVLKIVSPHIIHKTEVGGVRVIPKTPEKIRASIRRMLSEVPENFAQHIAQHPDHAPDVYAGLTNEALKKAIAADLRGVLQVQFMPPDSTAFGNELIVGLRRSREFGMVISAGVGGTDTELFAECFRKGQSIVVALTQLGNGKDFFEIFRHTVAYRKLGGLSRGQNRIITDEQLIECFESFIQMGNYFSPNNPDTPYIIEELEINPFTFTDYLMVPLDGMCRFSKQQNALEHSRPLAKIDNLLHPKHIGIIGVSSKKRNFGRLIVENIIAAGFAAENISLIGGGPDDIPNVRKVESLAALSEPVDLFVVAIAASHVPALVDDILKTNAAHAVMLIPGGLGETEESKEMAMAMAENIIKAHATQQGNSPIFIGANCMGIISRPGKYDTWFIPAEKMPDPSPLSPRRLAIISQSGAFLLNRYSQCPELRPAYLVSMGNQTDLTLGDMMKYFKNSSEVDVIAVYAEGFKDLDGLHFASAVREAVCAGKQVVFYKAGRTPEGKTATSGHTASMAGDYMVCESCIRQAGAIMAQTFVQFQDLTLLACLFHTKSIRGKRIGAISGAGFEVVGMADSIQSDEYTMTLGIYSQKTYDAMRMQIENKGLASLVTITNPLDINPGADDALHADMARIVLEDDGIDAVLIGLDPHSPVTHTLTYPHNSLFQMDGDENILMKIIEVNNSTDKLLVTVVDGGYKFDALRCALLENDVAVFPVCDRAMNALGLYIEARLAAEDIRTRE